jgi:hypothetical protein
MYAVRHQTTQVWSAPEQIDARAVGGDLSLTIDPSGAPAVAYHLNTPGDLAYARRGTSGEWTSTVIDQAGDVGDYASLQFAADGRPFVSYYDKTNEDLKLAWIAKSTGRWVMQTLETPGNLGSFSSLVIEPGTGLLHVTYADATGMRLKYARQLADGSWFIRSIDRTVTSGVRFNSITLDSNNRPWIAYFDVRRKDLRVATTADGEIWTSQRVAAPGTQGEYAQAFVNGAGKVSVLYTNRSLNTVNVSTHEGNGIWSHRFVGVFGKHLSVAVSPTGRTEISSVCALDNDLHTTTSAFTHAPTNDAEHRFVHWETIAKSSTIAADREIGWNIPEYGWGWYVTHRFADLQDLGAQRVLLHNPFGSKPFEPYYQFDQYLEALENPNPNLTQGFAEAWRPITDAGTEVIAYLGKLPGDPDFENLTDFNQYMDRVMRSIDPILRAGMSIGLDAPVIAGVTSRTWMVVEALRNSGVRVYAENRPEATSTWWHDVNGVYYNDGYISSSPAINPGMWWAATNDMLRGEIVRFLAHPPTGLGVTDPGWRGPESIDILLEGDTVAVDFPLLLGEGLTPRGLYETAMREAARPSASSGQVLPSIGGFSFGSRPLDDLHLTELV